MRCKVIGFLVILVIIWGQSPLFSAGQTQAEIVKKAADFYRKSVDMYGKKDYKGFLQNIEKSSQLLPRNWGYFYMKACGYALNGKNGAAIKALEQLVEIGRFFNIETEKDLDGLRKLDAFKALMVKLQEKKKPVINSSGAFVLKERDLFPEGIAYDPGEKAFFLSSAVKCKIVKIDRNGKCSDFTRSRQDGLLPTYGMRVDPQRRVLWVCSDFAYPRANIKKELFGTSGVFKYNLDTGKLIKKYMLPQKEEHMLNDVALAPDGTVYFSDSHVPGVYRIDSKTDKIKLFASLSNYGYPNGITYSPDTRKLYVSCSYYVVVVDVETGKVSELAHPENMYATGFDGLYYYKGSLLGIQIFTKPARVVRLQLDKEQTGVTELLVLEKNNPALIDPTTGVVAEGQLYFIADSQLGSIAKGKHPPIEKLRESSVFKIKLNLD